MSVQFDQIVERAAGLDVHKESIAACVRILKPDGIVEEAIQTFGTMTEDLLALRDWLVGCGVTHVAMESTGVFWKAPYFLLEDDMTVLLVNASHVKNVPGRKTDVKDCAWLAHLLQAGLLKGSFVPPPEIRDLRDLTRFRKQLVNDRTREVNRLHKVLQNAGIKLSSVATDIMGKSGRAMLEALIEGTTDPEVLAQLAKGRLRKKIAQLESALKGKFRGHHAFMLAQILALIDGIEAAMADVTAQIGEAIRPFTTAVALLDTMPGVNARTAEAVIAEIGIDMDRFPTAGHLASWARLCPGNNESAGKRRSGKAGKGNKWLRVALTEAARAAVREKDCYFSAQYRRLVVRLGDKKAIRAISHSMLVAIYHMLKTGTVYEELGGDYFTQRKEESVKRRAVRQLEQMGFRVTLEGPDSDGLPASA